MLCVLDTKTVNDIFWCILSMIASYKVSENMRVGDIDVCGLLNAPKTLSDSQ